MTPERWRQLEGLYDEVKDLSSAGRSARLKDAGPDLRSAMEAIFAQEPALERPAWEDHAGLLHTVTVFSVGMLLGPYQIERKIGEGGMGEVYRAADTRLARAVVVKTCRLEFDERFQREARVIASLNHRHICSLFNYLVSNYNLGTADAARLMAMVWTGVADSAIGCFNGKYKYGFWRPVTAITAGDGKPDTLADPAWSPLGTTPNHPEYPAAHGCLTGAATTLIADFFGITRVHVVTDSLAFTDGVHQHVFEDTRDWMDEVFWARIYAGFHFYHSLEAGRQLGETVAQGVARNHFRAVNSQRNSGGPQ